MLEDVTAAFENPEVEAVYGDLMYLQQADTEQIVRYWKSSALGHQCWHGVGCRRIPPYTSGASHMRGSEVLTSASCRISADYDFMLRVLGRLEGQIIYLPRVLVKMRIGGESNRSIRNILRKSAEDLRALRSTRVGGLGSLALKNASKLTQFVSRPKNR